MSAIENVVKCENCGHRNEQTAIFCGRCGSSFQKEEDPFIGRQVGRCILKKKIGVGGSGAVYQGIHSSMGKPFAIKVMHADLVADEESKLRFEREVQVLAGILHENIVSITDSGYVPGIGPYMEMEWLEGSTLFEERKNRGFLEFDEIVWIVDQMTDALSFMHNQGIVHRDLKPENMMLVHKSSQRGPEGQPQSLMGRVLKIFDFGIALLLEDSRKLTAAGMVVGTPHYMAPEQIIVDAPVDHRADLYAAGAICYELLCGQPPFWGAKKPVEVMERHLRRSPPPLHDIAPQRNFPAGIEEIMRRALAKNPADRFQDGRELFEALRNVLQPPTADDFTDEQTVVSSEGNLWQELQAAREAIAAGTFQYEDDAMTTDYSGEKTTPGSLAPVKPPSHPQGMPPQPVPGGLPFPPFPNAFPSSPSASNYPMAPSGLGETTSPGSAFSSTEKNTVGGGFGQQTENLRAPSASDTIIDSSMRYSRKSNSRSLLFGVFGVGLGMLAILIFYVLFQYLRSS